MEEWKWVDDLPGSPSMEPQGLQGISGGPVRASS